MGLPEQGHGAGNADGVGLAGGLTPGEGIPRGIKQIAGAAAFGGHFTAIEHCKLALRGIPVQQKTTTRQAGALGFHHRQHRLGCDQSIDGAAAFLQRS